MNNIFILGPVASGKNTLLEKISNNYDVISLDTGRVFRYVAYKLLEKMNGKINFEAIYNNDENEIKLLMESIYHSTKYVKLQLQNITFDGDKILENDIVINLNCLYTKKVNYLLPFIAKIQVIRNTIINFIDKSICSSSKPVIMTGHNIKEIDTTKFTIVYLDVEEKKSAYRLYQRNKDSYNDILDAYDEVLKRNHADKMKETKLILPYLYNYIYINTTNITEEEVYDEFLNKMEIYTKKNNDFTDIQKNAIDRKNFEWIFNPILEPIRARLFELTNGICLKYSYINQEDLIYQTLILLSSQNICELYENYNIEFLRQVEESIITRDQTIFNDLTSKINSGEININEKLVLQILELALNGLINLYSNNKVREIMSRYNRKISKGTLENSNGLMYIHNAENNVKIIFKEIDSKMSAFLSKYCHYLHTSREDELVAYGAFVENEIYPIAFVSFSKIDRSYKKQLLYNIGIEPQNVIEMIRAWCSNSAPQNIMSSLFQHSINELEKKWQIESRDGFCDKNLQAITTAINPNLGFKASSFLGCNFIPIALRPAQFTFRKSNDIIIYETRRKIESSSSDNLYFENQINILPLNELILCLDRNKIENIKNSKILLIDKDNYEKVLCEKKLIRKKEIK